MILWACQIHISNVKIIIIRNSFLKKLPMEAISNEEDKGITYLAQKS